MKGYSIIPILSGLLLFFLVYSYSKPENTERIYVGESVCRECHHMAGKRNQFNPWRLSKHSKAYVTLAMPESKKIAEISGVKVDPAKSPICLGCHTTASYTEPWERDETFHFEDGVQCELCHGPGSEHIDLERKRRNPETPRTELRMPGEEFCLVCHKEKGSHVAILQSKKFDFILDSLKITHRGKGGEIPELQKSPVESLPGSKYVGVFECSQCHKGPSMAYPYNQWRLSKHAEAYAILGTDEAWELARKEGVPGNPQSAEACLKCHVIATGEPAGRFAETFDPAQGVQCESCHGPGGEYIAEAIMLDPVASHNAGLLEVNRETCLECHTEAIHGKTFEFETMWKQIKHFKTEQIETSSVEYKTPFNLAVTQDGKRLFVACEASNSLIVVRTKTGEILAETKINSQPHYVCFSPDETRVYVSNRGADNVSVIDTKTYQVLSTIPVGDEPHEMVTDIQGDKLYVANAGSYDISVIDLKKGQEIKRLSAGRGTWGVARSPGGKSIYVTNNLSHYVEFRTPSLSEVTVIGTDRSFVENRIFIPEANLVQGIDVAPDGEFAIITLNRTKNLIPMTRVIQGWVIINGIGVLWRDGHVDQLLLDEVDSYFADPTDVVITKDGRFAFISGGGVNSVAMVDLKKMKQVLLQASDKERHEIFPNHLGISTEYVVKRIPVGRSPRGMAISHDNKFLYVADGLDDAISIIDIKKKERIRVFDLGGPKEITQARRGERIFHSANVTYGRQFSCHTCHPDGSIDGITYDIEPDGLGINPVDNRSLRGILDTAPFKWTGKNPTLRRQCGPRLAVFFTRIDPFTPDEAEALEHYIRTIPKPPNRYQERDKQSPVLRRGKQIFERTYDNAGKAIPLTNRCNFCHPPPYYTRRVSFDVGTGSWLDTNHKFDVPHLNNIYETPPYLHDGRAETLEEIWTRFNPYDQHGVTNDMTKDQLNDLIEFLKTL